MDDSRRVRQYTVPRWMIDECTAARERGDWRAGCAAGRVTVGFADAGPVADLLAGFAPDLVRRHLPRSQAGSGALAGGGRYVLAPDGPVTPDTMVLELRTSPWTTGSQRLTLDAVRAGALGEGRVVPLPPYLWDARRADELRAVSAAADDGAWTPQAWAAAGWALDGVEESSWSRAGLGLLPRVDPGLAARELRRVAEQFGHRSWPLWRDLGGRDAATPQWHLRLELAGGGPRVAWGRQGAGPTGLCLYAPLLRPPVDDLVPLASVVPDGFAEEEHVRVRCGADWHRIGVRGGRLDLLDHTGDERRREQALRAFGGEMSGCFRVESAWFGGGAGLPRRLREYRRDLWRRMEHGGSRVVLALLDAGLDPHLRDEHGRTLLHRIHQFEHAELLPRLLAEGLDVNAVNRGGYTPMCEVLAHEAPYDLVLALNEAGAIPRLAHGGGS
ncbi:ankyrin repeat domain-containing protein [Dactylosporangium sp. CA-052675]|uniref:ankyrin repeat domain-containing protein n=1 Tax=Dactylosporangium sp. CA-052675 TaxID=3239927 RepID=UPI003D8D6593